MVADVLAVVGVVPGFNLLTQRIARCFTVLEDTALFDHKNFDKICREANGHIHVFYKFNADIRQVGSHDRSREEIFQIELFRVEVTNQANKLLFLLFFLQRFAGHSLGRVDIPICNFAEVAAKVC